MRYRSEPSKGATLPSERARQGETTGRVRVILTVSLVLAILVFVGVALYWQHPGQRPPAPPNNMAAPEAAQRPQSPPATGP
jgi:hypothetical protein